MVPIRRALVSVYDKRGIDLLAAALLRHRVQVLSTGGTAAALRDAGIAVIDVAAWTGAPELLDGRVKTLHPRIHGGLLGRATTAHESEMAQHGIPPIDLLVVNLYPFQATVERAAATLDDIIENIDIGGPAMIRSAGKNHERVTVIVDPDDYASVAAELDAGGGHLAAPTRRRLARKAFAHTAAYDAAIANFLNALPDDAAAVGDPGADRLARRAALPEVLTLQWVHGRPLRYGENPHQGAAFYAAAAAPGPSLAQAEVLQGKEISYNNLLDLDAALGLVLELAGPAAVVVKHGNPCGAATSAVGIVDAYTRARAGDPLSAFGGVVALNRPVDGGLAAVLAETFLECVLAPRFDEAARAILAAKKGLRLLALPFSPGAVAGLALRSVHGGLLVQTRDDRLVAAVEATVATSRAPTAAERDGLDFAWRVAKHVKSNAIVLARVDGEAVETVGVGAGQMSRVDSVRIAVEKAGPRARGSVLASDAFFPFRDGVDAAAAAGVSAVIQPGGSLRDEEVLAAARERDLAMLFTHTRHFRH